MHCVEFDICIASGSDMDFTVTILAVKGFQCLDKLEFCLSNKDEARVSARISLQ